MIVGDYRLGRMGRRGGKGGARSGIRWYVRKRQIRASLHLRVGRNGGGPGSQVNTEAGLSDRILSSNIASRGRFGPAHLEVRLAHVLMLLDVEPEIERILGRFALEEDLYGLTDGPRGGRRVSSLDGTRCVEPT